MHATRAAAAQADISLDHLHLRWGAGAVSNAIAPGRGSVKTGGRGSPGANSAPRLRKQQHCGSALTPFYVIKELERKDDFARNETASPRGF